MRALALYCFLLVCAGAQAITLRMPAPGDDVVGEVMTIEIARYENTLNDYAEAYGFGFRELMAANPGINPWVPGEGRKVVLPGEFILPPGERVGVVINLAEQRLYFYQPDGKTVITYPVGIGREDWQTPLVSTTVTRIVKDPSWTPPASIRAEHAAMGDPLPAVVPPGPDNPLGPWAVRLATPGYLIHGTNKDIGVGMRVSHGCMRLYNGDVEDFARRVKPGTPVRIINSPVKVGWKGGEMYVEVHEALEEQRGAHVPEVEVADGIHIANRLAREPVEIDWVEAKSAAVERSGMPVRVSAQRVVVR